MHKHTMEVFNGRRLAFCVILCHGSLGLALPNKDLRQDLRLSKQEIYSTAGSSYKDVATAEDLVFLSNYRGLVDSSVDPLLSYEETDAGKAFGGDNLAIAPHDEGTPNISSLDAMQIASTTRYWDCSGGSCGCAYSASTDGEPTHCSSNAMFVAPSGNPYNARFYGTAAVSEALGGGPWLSESCGRCWKLTGTSNIPHMPETTTSVVLKGANFCPPENPVCANGRAHFDIAAPGFDVLAASLANTCSKRDPTEAKGYETCTDWMIASLDPTENCDCGAFNDPILRNGCNNFRLLSWDNVNVTYEEVSCPVELIRLSCWEENGNKYPEDTPQFCASNLGPSVTSTTNPTPSVASTTSYWDCGGGACGCGYSGANGEPTHCNSNAMFAAPEGNQYNAKFYGTAGVSEALGGDWWQGEGCGRCWKVTGESNIGGSPSWSTTLVLKGANFCPPENPNCAGGKPHFAIAAPGFDHLGHNAKTCGLADPQEAQAYSACSKWMVNSSDPAENCDCGAFNDPTLRAGCVNFRSLNWYNVNVTYEKVECPPELTRLSCWVQNGFDYPDGIPQFCESNIAEIDSGLVQPTYAPTSISTHGDESEGVKRNIEWMEQPWKWTLVLVFMTAATILNFYGIAKAVNILDSLIKTKMFTDKPKQGGLIPKGQEPVVTIQICVYNEPTVIEDTMNAACTVDWPKDKLVVQVLDDSTDEACSLLVEELALRWRNNLVNCSRLSRPNRVGYKAGNLFAHTSDIKGDFVAIFDSDHRCEHQWLRRAIPHFFKTDGSQDATVGLVQSPWAYYNTHQNILTEYDSLQLDVSHVIEQTARSDSLQCFGFNGTGGIWRTQAIHAGGGWSWDTITEDLDLSYQAFYAGHKFIYLRDIPQQLEVPSGILAHIQQKHRWTKGFFQVVRKRLPGILRHPNARLAIKWEAFFHVTGPITYPATLVLMLIVPIMSYFDVLTPFMMVYGSFLGFVASFAFVVTIYAKVPSSNGHYQSFWGRTYRLLFIPWSLLIAMGMCIFETYAIWDGLYSDDTTFVRTPKEGISATTELSGVASDREFNGNEDEVEDDHQKLDNGADETSLGDDSNESDTNPTKKKHHQAKRGRMKFLWNVPLGLSGLFLAAYNVAWSVVLFWVSKNDQMSWTDHVQVFFPLVAAIGFCLVHGMFIFALLKRRRAQRRSGAKNFEIKNSGDSAMDQTERTWASFSVSFSVRDLF